MPKKTRQEEIPKVVADLIDREVKKERKRIIEKMQLYLDELIKMEEEYRENVKEQNESTDPKVYINLLHRSEAIEARTKMIKGYIELIELTS